MEEDWRSQSQRQHDGDVDERRRLDEEYTAARIAASEAVAVGREVAREVSEQGERLARADLMADQNLYIIEKSNRILRGMTWSGWFANKFSSDVKAPTVAASGRGARDASSTGTTNDEGEFSSSDSVLRSVEDLYSGDYPPRAEQAVSDVRSYHRHVDMLRQCTTDEQRDACGEVCDALRLSAAESLRGLEWAAEGNTDDRSRLRDVHVRLVRVMDGLDETRGDRQPKSGGPTAAATTGAGGETRRREQASNASSGGSMSAAVVASSHTSAVVGESSDGVLRQELFSTRSTKAETSVGGVDGATAASSSSKGVVDVERRLAAQEEHLSTLAPNLDELKFLGHAIGRSLHEHNDVLESLNEKSDDLTERTKQVVRRADRMTQRSRVRSVKPVVQSLVTIQHIPTNKYLSVIGDYIELADRRLLDASTFRIWKRGEGSLIGLQNCLTGKWLGQTLFGSIACTASSFGSREQWEVDEDNMAGTRLLCASANWGAGGWISVREKDSTLVAGSNDVEGKKLASLWKIAEVT